MRLHRESPAYWDGYNAAAKYVQAGGSYPDAPDDLSDDEQDDWKRGVDDGFSDS